jgi:hypothetical protein
MAPPVGRLVNVRSRSAAVAVIAFLATLAILTPAVARAAGGPVNVTLKIPADVRPNPCTPGDFVNVSGTLHIVYYVREDGSGGFHVDQLVREHARGTSLTTGIGYLLSDTHDESWQASAGVAHTSILTSTLVSQAGTDNFLMRVRMHTTINALGVPTAAVDEVTLECAG